MTVNEKIELKEKLHKTNGANKITAYIQKIKELNTVDDLNELPSIIASDDQINDDTFDVLFDLVMKKIDTIKNGETMNNGETIPAKICDATDENSTIFTTNSLIVNNIKQ